MFLPEFNRKEVLSEIKVQISEEQFERLETVKFNGNTHFELNDAYTYEATIFHELCKYSITPERISNLIWANHKYNNGEEAVTPRCEQFTIRNIVTGFCSAIKNSLKSEEI